MHGVLATRSVEELRTISEFFSDAVLEELRDRPQLLGAASREYAVHPLALLGVQRNQLVLDRLERRRYDHLSAVSRIGLAGHEAVRLQPVDHAGDRAGRQAGALGQLAWRERAVGL